MEVLNILTSQSWKEWTDKLSDRLQQAMFETGPGGRHHATVPLAAAALKEVLTIAEGAKDAKALEARAKTRRVVIQRDARANMSEEAWKAAAMEETTSLFLQS